MQAGLQVFGWHEGAGVGITQAREKPKQTVGLFEEVELDVGALPLSQCCMTLAHQPSL